MSRRALTALLLVLTGVSLGFWVLGTASGLRASLQLAERWTGGQFTVEDSDGRWWGPVDLQGLHYQRPGLSVAIARLRLDWQPWRLVLGRLRLQRVQVDGLHVRTEGAKAAADGERFALNAPLPMRFDDVRVSGLEVIRADGQPIILAELDMAGFWRGPWLHFDHLRFTHPATGPVEASGGFIAAFGSLRFRDLRLSGPGQLQVDGTLGLDADAATALHLRGGDLRWPLQGVPQIADLQAEAWIEGAGRRLRWRLGASRVQGPALRGEGMWTGQALEAEWAWTDLAYPLDADAPRWTSPEGRLHFQGWLDHYRWDLVATVASGAHDVRLAAQGSGDMAQLQIDEARLLSAQGELRGTGRIGWEPELNADLALQAEGLNPAVLWPQWPGAISGRLELSRRGGANPPATGLRLRITDSTLRGHPLAAEADGVYDGAALQVQRAQLQLGGTVVHLAGQVTPPYAVRGRINSPDLRALWPELAGQLEARFRFEGELRRPNLQLNGKARALRYGELAAGEVRAEIALHAQRTSQAHVELDDVVLGRHIDRLVIDAGGSLRDHDVRVRAQLPDLDLMLAAQGGLNLQPWHWRGAIEASRFAPAEGGAWVQYGSSPLQLRAGQIRLEPVCLRQADSFACVGLAHDAAQTEVRARLETLAIPLLQPFMPADWRAEGALSGHLVLRLADGQLRDIAGELRSSAGAIRAGTQAQLEFLPSRIALQPQANGGLHAQLDLQLVRGSAQGELRFQPGSDLPSRRFAGSLALDLPDLSFLTLASPEIAAARGQLIGDFALAGTLRDPHVDGELQVRDGELQLTTPGIRLTDLALNVTTEAGQRTAITARAASGGGNLEVQGRILQFARPFRATFVIRGEDFQAADTPAARIWVSPDLTLGVEDRRVELRGEILVPRARIAPRELELGVSPSEDQVIIGGDGADTAEEELRIHSRVLLRLGEDVRFEGYGLRTGLSGRLLAIDEPGRPTVARGELRLEGGRYKAYGQELEIETGRLIYAGGPVTVPGLDLRALRRPREDVTVGVLVRGTLDQPSVSLFSSPAMPRDQQLSWLVLGRGVDDLPGGTGGDAYGGAAMSLGLKGGDLLAQRLGKELGLDQISVGSRPGETADQARLMVGKYLSPKLFVSYGFGLFEPGRYFRLLYDLGRGFKLSTEGGVNTGADLLYSIER